MKRIKFFLMIVCLMIIAHYVSADEDTVPPILQSVSVSPQTVIAGGTVSMIIVAVDNLSGVNTTGQFPNGVSSPSQARLTSPGGTQHSTIIFQHFSSNTYSGSAAITEFAETGTWMVEYVYLVDNAGNSQYYYNGTDYNATFEVSQGGIEDITPPVMHSISIAPPVVVAGSSITVTVDATDDVSGIKGNIAVWLENPSKTMLMFLSLKHETGNMYSKTDTMTEYAENGTWHVREIQLRDNADNYKSYFDGQNGFAKTFDVVNSSGVSDISPPVLYTVTVDTSTVVVGSSITIMVEAADVPAGINTSGQFLGGTGSPSQVRVKSPGRSQYETGILIHISSNTYHTSISINTFAETGTWMVEYVYLVDNAGNSMYYQNPTEFVVNFEVIASTGSQSDVTAPTLVNVQLDKNIIGAGEDLTITITAHDDLSGINTTGSKNSPSQVRIISPSGNQNATAIFAHVTGSTYDTLIPISPYAELGIWIVEYIFLTDNAGNTATLSNGTHFNVSFQVVSAIQTVSVNQDTKITVENAAGKVIIDIPKNSFAESTNIMVNVMDNFAAALAAGDTLKPVPLFVEITNDKNLQPTGNITLTMYYDDSDVLGMDKKNLVIARYDEDHNQWIVLPSSSYPNKNMLVAQTNHLSLFGIFERAPALNLGIVNIYPNPYNPARHTKGLTIANLTVNASIKIYTIAGELVREIREDDGDGICVWDGKNDAGKDVASGIYICYIENDNEHTTMKIAVEK